MSSPITKETGNLHPIGEVLNKTTNEEIESLDTAAKTQIHDTQENIAPKTFSHCKGFKIVHLNARSLLPKLDSIKHNFTPQTIILCFTETWFKPELVLELTQIPNYNLIRNDRKNKRGGGTQNVILYEYYKPVIWNSLPPNIRSINDPNQYKTEIKRYYIRMFLSDNNLDQDH